MNLIKTFKEYLQDLANPSKKVIVDWSYPKMLTSLLESNDDVLFEIGIYQITTTYKGEESFLYIGKTYNDFKTRLTDHSKKWLNSYKGDKKVRFGTITAPKKITEILLEEVEKAIIFETQPLQNTKAIQGYSLSRNYAISSQGKRGFVPAKILTKLHIQS